MPCVQKTFRLVRLYMNISRNKRKITFLSLLMLSLSFLTSADEISLKDGSTVHYESVFSANESGITLDMGNGLRFIDWTQIPSEEANRLDSANYQKSVMRIEANNRTRLEQLPEKYQQPQEVSLLEPISEMKQQLSTDQPITSKKLNVTTPILDLLHTWSLLFPSHQISNHDEIATHGLENTTARSDFALLSKQLVLIKTDSGRGSGFIAKIENSKYIITNQHVVSNTRKIRIMQPDGTMLLTTHFEVSQELDLVRLKLSDSDAGSLAAFLIADRLPSINEKITVFGDSQGREVITKIKGIVLAVGPKEIETNAKFVPGNSGSPIIDKTGKVLGVATYATRYSDNDWTTKGTRFEKVRRFGMRLKNDIKWQRVSPNRFRNETYILSDMKTFLTDVIQFLTEKSYSEIHYDFDYEKTRYHNIEWCKKWDFFCKFYNRELSKYSRRASAHDFTRISMGMRNMLIKLIDDTRAEISNIKWSSKFLRDEATSLDELAQIVVRLIRKSRTID